MNRELHNEFQPGVVEMDVNPAFLRKGLVFHRPTYEGRRSLFDPGHTFLTREDLLSIRAHIDAEDRLKVALVGYNMEKDALVINPNADRTDLDHLEQLVQSAYDIVVDTNSLLPTQKQAVHPFPL